MNFPFEAYVDKKNVEKWHVYTDGKSLIARVLPNVKWTKPIKKHFEEPVHLYLFATPLSQYKDLEKHIDDMEDKETVMGEMPTLKEYKQSKISTDLQPGFLYDLFATGQINGNRVFVGGGRLSTQEGKVPYNMTLDELKLFAIEDLDLSPKEAQNIRAKITPMTAWNGKGRLIIAGFEFGQKESEWNYGTMVQHNGIVSHYHNDSKEELRKLLKV